MNFLTKLKLLQFSYNFEKDYISKIVRNTMGFFIIGMGLLFLGTEILFHLSKYLYYGGFFALLMGFFTILTGDIDIHSPKKLVIETINPNHLNNINTNGTYGEYYREEFNGQYYIYSDLINGLLSKYTNQLVFLDEKFELTDDLRKLAPFSLHQFPTVKNNKLFGSQARLVTDITPGRIIHAKDIIIQESDYFSGLCSNELVLKKIWSKNFKEPIFSGFNLLAGRDLIVNLEDSFCANLIGVNTLLLTADGKVISEIQGANYADNYSQIIPSISTSMEYPKTSKTSLQRLTLQSALINNVNQNLMRKYNLQLNEISSFLIGYARLLNRGGKPEFFLISMTTKNFAELKHNKNMCKEIIDLSLGVWNPEELAGMIKYIGNSSNASIQLHLNCLFLEEQLSDNQDLKDFLFNK